MSSAALRRAIDPAAVQQAIAEVELRTSGEIRVSVSHLFWGDVRRIAESAFDRLGLRETAERNGLLIFVVPSRRKFVILGDVGIHAKAGQPLFDSAAATLSTSFAAGDYTRGLVSVIAALGDALAVHFPRCDSDVNELPDAVDYGGEPHE